MPRADAPYPLDPCPDAPPPTPYEEVPTVGRTGPHPFESVCRLHVERDKFVWRPTNFSTAFLIDDDVLVTAAHNVHSQGFWRFSSRVRHGSITAGHAADGPAWSAAGRFGPSDVRVASGYQFWPKRYDRDYALILLPSPAPYRSSFRLLRPDDRSVERCEPVFIAGHPGDPLDSKRMHTARGRVTHVGPHLITYDIDTQRGNSGGPVWVERDDGEYVVAGIHVSETTGGRARRIDQEVRDDIQCWRTRRDGPR